MSFGADIFGDAERCEGAAGCFRAVESLCLQAYRPRLFVSGSNPGRRTCGIQHIIKRHIFHISISALVTGKNTNSHTEIDIRIATVHRSVFQAVNISKGMFKEKISIVSSLFKSGSQYLSHIFFTHSKMVHSR